MIHRLTEVRKAGGSFSAHCLCGFSSVSYSKPYATAKLYMHVIEASKQPCPTPQKKQYPNQVHAENAMSKFLRSTQPGFRPVRAYQCRCGFWHLTKQPTPNRGKVA